MDAAGFEAERGPFQQGTLLLLPWGTQDREGGGHNTVTEGSGTPPKSQQTPPGVHKVPTEPIDAAQPFVDTPWIFNAPVDAPQLFMDTPWTPQPPPRCPTTLHEHPTDPSNTPQTLKSPRDAPLPLTKTP